MYPHISKVQGYFNYVKEYDEKNFRFLATLVSILVNNLLI